jgi:hypothetical protein
VGELATRDTNLVCYGCAHSIAPWPFPSGPSGERPCGFCVRNPSVDPETGVDPNYAESYRPVWYDGSQPIKTPMDNYIATDRLQQEFAWERTREEAR